MFNLQILKSYFKRMNLEELCDYCIDGAEIINKVNEILTKCYELVNKHHELVRQPISFILLD